MIKKLLKYFAIGLGAFLLLVFLGGLLLTRFFGDDLKAMVEREVNKQINTEFRISGAVHISLFRHFPNAVISLEGLELDGSLPANSLLLMKAGKLSFTMNVLRLIRKNFSIHKVLLEDSEVNLLTNATGENNYEIFKASKPAENTSNAVAFQLHEANIKTLHLRYTDHQADDQADLTLDEAAFSGLFSGQKLDLDADIKINSKELRLNHSGYLGDEKIALNGHILADLEQHKFSSDGFQLETQDGAYVFAGSIDKTGTDYLMNLSITGSHLNVRSVLALMPESIHQDIAAWDSKGQLDLQATLKGPIGKGQIPRISALLNLSDATIYNYAYDQEFTDVRLDATFSNGSTHSAKASVLSIDKMEARLDDEPISLTADIRDFDDPVIKAHIDGIINLNPLQEFLSEAGLYQADGQIVFDDVGFTLSPGRAQNQEAVLSDAGGNINFDDVDIFYAGKKIKKLSGHSSLEGSLLKGEKIQTEINASALEWTGTLDHWMAQFFAPSGKIPMVLTGEVKADELEFDELLTYYGAPEIPDESTEGEPADYLSDFYLFSGSVKLDIANLSYQDFRAENIKTNLEIEPGTIAFHPLTGKIAGGMSKIDGLFKVENDSILLGRFHGDFDQVDVSDLFSQLHNFGQDYLTDDMLSGDLKTNLDIDLYFDQSLNLLQDRLRAIADVKLEDGRLRDCETLEQLSSFVKVKELKDIQFNEIENTIKIENSTVIIPAMIVRSTALNLLLCGEHHFDNQIAYYFKINMLDMLARKFHFGKISVDESEQIQEGLINLYVSMIGDAIDPSIETNKKLVKERLYSDYYGPSDIRNKIKQYNAESERIDWDNNAGTDSLEYINW